MNKSFAVAVSSSVLLYGLLLTGCSSEEPKKEPPTKESAAQAIQAAADKAHKVIDQTAATSQNLAERAQEIKDTASKAAKEMSATVQKSGEVMKEQIATPPPTPAEPAK